MTSFRIVMFVFFSCCTITAFGSLGETESEALAKQTQWKNQFGAVAPLIEVDESGQVVQECWSGPPKGWMPVEAVAFVKELLGPGANLEIIEKSSNRMVFEDISGAMVFLTGYNATFFDLEITTASYQGRRC